MKTSAAAELKTAGIASAGPNLAQSSPGAGSIEIKDVVHRFGETVLAVSNVSLNIKPGEFVSIVGPSGCGKTTLLNLAAGLIPVQQGSVSVLGKPPKEGRHDIAYMLARDSLLPWLDAQGNAEFGTEIRNVSKDERRTRASHRLRQVGLKGFENAYPKALSQGMRQRVALARTFCLDSPILLMDEPFGALDAQTKLQLEEVLLALWNEERRTVLFITHDLSEAIVLSDRVIVMKARPGSIIADIPIDLPRPRLVRALQKDHRYHELYAEVWSKLETALETK
jgi:NitT/TauT family transport system ATP-binding protein